MYDGGVPRDLDAHLDAELGALRDREQARRLLSVVRGLSTMPPATRSPALVAFEARCRDDAAVVLRRIAARRQPGQSASARPDQGAPLVGTLARTWPAAPQTRPVRSPGAAASLLRCGSF
jgi:hypothetical protein